MADKRRRNWSAFLTGQADEGVATSAEAPPSRAPGGDGDPVGARRVARPVRPGGPPVGPAGQDPERVAPVDDGVIMVLEEDPYGDPLVDPRYDRDDRNWVRYRSTWGGFLRLVLFAVLVVLAVMWVRDRIYGWVDAQIDPTGEQGALVEFTIPEGASTNDVAGQLDQEGIIANATVFRYWLRCETELTITGFLGCDTEHTFQAGDYVLFENMAFEDVVEVLDEGPIPEVFHTVSIPEGLRWTEMADRLVEENPSFDRSELEDAFSSAAVVSDHLGTDVPGNTMEGLLFPATYDISEDDLGDESAFLRRLSGEMDRRLDGLLASPGLPPEAVQLDLDAYDMVVIASLVEEEAKLAADRPKIARVIYNRLLTGERLGIDATACYAANKSCADLTAEDLENPSPWNTRVVAGLPPTPIAAPGQSSLEAAFQPAEGPWLFYVLTDEDGVAGAHHFSETLAEHNEYVQVCRDLGYCG
ncbi:MAG: endolytic transglycosylase MltG [Acidimicrobiales bacterium]